MLNNERQAAKETTTDVNTLKDTPINKPNNNINTAPRERHFPSNHGLSSKEREFNQMYGGW